MPLIEPTYAMPSEEHLRTDWVRDALRSLIEAGKLRSYYTKGMGSGWRWGLEGSTGWHREYTQRQAEAFVLGYLITSRTYEEPSDGF